MIAKRMKLRESLARIGKIGKCRIDHEMIMNPKGHEVFMCLSDLSDSQLERLLKIAARRKWEAKQ